MEENILKNLISRVNSTLGYYEKDYVSAQRTPDLDKERCTSFEEYIEIRFNREAYNIPELRNAVIETDGRLFSCVELSEPNVAKRRFKEAKIKLLNPDLLLPEDQNLKNEILKVRDLIGGTSISFNSVRKKVKLIVSNDE